MPLNRDLHQTWLAASQADHRGIRSPPSPTEVAKRQYDLMTPWHLRTTIWKDVRGLGTWKGKKWAAYTWSRDHGKSIGIGMTLLWACEYVIPFLPDLRHENRRAIVIGRDTDHLKKENMNTIENLICEYAPWLKTTDQDLWGKPDELKNLSNLGGRTWNITQKDLTNGVSIRGYGFRTSVRAGHVPIIVADDFYDEDDAHHGEQHFSKLLGSVEPAILNGGIGILTGTTIHENEVWKPIKGEPRFHYKSLPAIDINGTLGYKAQNLADLEAGHLKPEHITDDSDLDCLWPRRFDRAALKAIEGTTPKSQQAFAREYMMQHAAAWDRLVHQDYFEQSKNSGIHYLSTAAPGMHTFMGVDPSTLKRNNFVIWVGAKLQANGHDIIRPLYRELIEIKPNEDTQERKRRVMACLHRLRVTFARFNPRKVAIEGNGFQSTIEPILEAQDARMRGRIESIDLTIAKHYDTGWPIIRTVFENGHIEMPWGPTPHEVMLQTQGEIEPGEYEARRITRSFWEELEGIRFKDARIVEDDSRQTDQVAAFYMMLRAADYTPPNVEIGGVPLDGKGTVKSVNLNNTRNAHPELQPRGIAPNSAMGQLQKARNWTRR